METDRLVRKPGKTFPTWRPWLSIKASANLAGLLALPCRIAEFSWVPPHNEEGKTVDPDELSTTNTKLLNNYFWQMVIWSFMWGPKQSPHVEYLVTGMMDSSSEVSNWHIPGGFKQLSSKSPPQKNEGNFNGCGRYVWDDGLIGSVYSGEITHISSIYLTCCSRLARSPGGCWCVSMDMGNRWTKWPSMGQSSNERGHVARRRWAELNSETRL